MSKPEHVRCENCCYFDLEEGLDSEDGSEGTCYRFTPFLASGTGEAKEPLTAVWPQVAGHEWCGEFREEWPGE